MLTPVLDMAGGSFGWTDTSTAHQTTLLASSLKQHSVLTLRSGIEASVPR